MPGWLRANSTAAFTSSGVSSQRTAASLLMNRVLKQITMKPRLDNSVQAILFKLFAVRCATRKATCGAGPLSGRYIAALTRPRGTNSGWLCAKTCAGKASAAAIPSEHALRICPNLIGPPWPVNDDLAGSPQRNLEYCVPTGRKRQFGTVLCMLEWDPNC